MRHFYLTDEKVLSGTGKLIRTYSCERLWQQHLRLALCAGYAKKKETELPFCRKDYKSFVNTSAKDACGDLTCVTSAAIAVLDEAPVEEVAESAEGEATSGESG